MSNDPKEVWPDPSELRLLSREAGEHRRAWGLVGGLCKTIAKERGEKGQPSSDQQAARIHGLEQKIVKQRRALAQLEECRAFERETEQLLVDTLLAIANMGLTAKKQQTVDLAEEMLTTLRQRKGPRPEVHLFPVVDLS